VFKVLWAEPKPEGADGEKSESDSSTIRTGAGGIETYASVRRFLVISSVSRRSVCLLVAPEKVLGIGLADLL
jgi:hypothetical protein